LALALDQALVSLLEANEHVSAGEDGGQVGSLPLHSQHGLDLQGLRAALDCAAFVVVGER
jgi:hypothetical protein